MVKWLPASKNDSLVVDTLRSYDYPVINTPRILTPQWWIFLEVSTLQWMQWMNTGEYWLPSGGYTGESWLPSGEWIYLAVLSPVVNITANFDSLGACTGTSKNNKILLTVTPRCIHQGKSQLPGCEYIGESFANSDNYVNILKSSKAFQAISFGPGEVMWWNQLEQKIRVTLSLLTHKKLLKRALA
jgi:hypothetical protein